MLNLKSINYKVVYNKLFDKASCYSFVFTQSLAAYGSYIRGFIKILASGLLLTSGGEVKCITEVKLPVLLPYERIVF